MKSKTGFRLPPDLSFEKQRLSNAWAYVFQHRLLGEIGRILLQELGDGRCHISCEVINASASVTHIMTAAIETEIPSLVLRFLKEEDAEELFLINDQNREHLKQWLPWLDGVKNPSDTLTFIRRSLESAAAGTAFCYVILLNGKIVGVVSFNDLERTNRCGTIGYWLARSYTGRGFMTAAVKSLINQGFQQLELNRIQARVATGNHVSQAVCNRLGLKSEGILRQAEWLYDHYVDLTMNSVLRSEWNESLH